MAVGRPGGEHDAPGSSAPAHGAVLAADRQRYRRPGVRIGLAQSCCPSPLPTSKATRISVAGRPISKQSGRRRAIKSGDTVATEAHLKATSVANNRRLVLPMMAMLRFRDGLLIEEHEHFRHGGD